MPQFKSSFDCSDLSDISDFIEKTLKHLGCDNANIISDLKLAIDEASTNIMKHGQTGQKKSYFTISIEKEGEDIDIEITDFGLPYPFYKKNQDFLFLSKKDKISSGHGLHFIRSLTDDSKYNSYSDKNVLKLKKHVSNKETKRGHK